MKITIEGYGVAVTFDDTVWPSQLWQKVQSQAKDKMAGARQLKEMAEPDSPKYRYWELRETAYRLLADAASELDENEWAEPQGADL